MLKCDLVDADETDLYDKIIAFINDRESNAVTGIRRIGRLNLIRILVDVATDIGLKAECYPVDNQPDIIVF